MDDGTLCFPVVKRRSQVITCNWTWNIYNRKHSDAADAVVDDITPSAFEEANDQISTYSTDIGIGSGTMNLAYSNGDIMEQVYQ